MVKPTVKAVEGIRKKYGIAPNGALSVEQYREACSMSIDNQKVPFAFKYTIVSMSKQSITLEVHGDHLSKNVVDSLPFKQKLAYKKAFKDGAIALRMLEKGRIDAFPAMEKAIISFVFYSKKSRDYDNNSENIKRIQDTLVSLGFLVDDKRKNLTSKGNPKEVIVKSMPKVTVRIDRLA